MKSELIEQASEIVSDPATLINAVSQRLKQLNEGFSPLVKAPSTDYGKADIALLEIIEGKVKVSLASELPEGEVELAPVTA